MTKFNSKLSFFSLMTIMTIVFIVIVLPVLGGEGITKEQGEITQEVTNNNIIVYPFSRFVSVAAAATYGRKLITTNEITLQVDSVNEVKEKVRKIKAGRGFIGTSDFNIDESGNSVSTIDLKVAADTYPTVRDEIIKLGNVLSEKEDVQDVGDDYFDTQSYINTRNVYHSQLIKILGQQTKLDMLVNLSEMVTNVQQEINESKSSLNRFDNQMKFASVKINLIQTSKIKLVASNVIQIIKEKRPKYIWTCNTALDEGIYQFKYNLNYIINWIILQFTANIIYWVLSIIFIVISIRLVRRYITELREFFNPQPIMRKPARVPQESVDTNRTNQPTKLNDNPQPLDDQQFSQFEKPFKGDEDEE